MGGGIKYGAVVDSLAHWSTFNISQKDAELIAKACDALGANKAFSFSTG